MSPPPVWIQHAVPLSLDEFADAQKRRATRYVTRERLHDVTGLSDSTINDILIRRLWTDSPRAELACPAAYVAGAASPIPLWSEAQVERFLHRRESEGHVEYRSGALPGLTAEQAARHGMATARDLALRTGANVNSVRRWSRYDDSFPQPVATLMQPGAAGGRRHMLYSAAAAEPWIRERLTARDGRAIATNNGG